MSKTKKQSPGVYSFNKRARHDYTILETFEAGICLLGTEVKSIKSGGKVQFNDSYVKIINDEAYLINCFITKYAHAAKYNHDETKTRKLLMHKRETAKLSNKLYEKNLTLVPIKLYAKKHLIKLEIGLAKGKKDYEKRDDLKKKDVNRELSKQFKQNQIKL
ncbi:MAG: SsrA-binding protein [Candidatus Cloacimonadota bacterium]|nr:MAG: SsrA-binding protein [Candidatus Cloacimonadota bacterium]